MFKQEKFYPFSRWYSRTKKKDEQTSQEVTLKVSPKSNYVPKMTKRAGSGYFR